ncbi:hypothetical protein PACTADRAFT_837 [Pachysolen tannophilus NRRL Y-2460]|uniref:NECAP PHear domain-containing protein n=1 Tax=Pachysolen tannophilus NRRL Y-2460 TaxID=669874 RepID=A0A1E4U2X4_PACTA|nr:hypothetical protein PACTADRAFT_837 [Pachysolen tannophilus NRRL Y-2460]
MDNIDNIDNMDNMDSARLTDDDKLESVLFETSGVSVYKIPPPTIKKEGADGDIYEEHNVYSWKLDKKNLVFTGRLKMTEIEILSDDEEEEEEEEDDDEEEEEEEEKEEKDEGGTESCEPSEQHQQQQQNQVQKDKLKRDPPDFLKLRLDLINFHDNGKWISFNYRDLARTKPINKSVKPYYNIQPVKDSLNLYLMIVDDEKGNKIGLGLKFPNRYESSSFHTILNLYLKHLSQYEVYSMANSDNVTGTNESASTADGSNRNHDGLLNAVSGLNIMGEGNGHKSRIFVREISDDSDEDDDSENNGKNAKTQANGLNHAKSTSGASGKRYNNNSIIEEDEDEDDDSDDDSDDNFGDFIG